MQYAEPVTCQDGNNPFLRRSFTRTVPAAPGGVVATSTKLTQGTDAPGAIAATAYSMGADVLPDNALRGITRVN